MKGGMSLSRGVFWAVVWIAVALLCLWVVGMLGSIVGIAVLFVVGAATDSTFLSFAAATVAVIGVAVLVALFFIGAYKVLFQD
jgi:hypothetical protein